MPSSAHDAGCVSCAAAVSVGALAPAEAVALLRAFFVRHERCLTTIDLDAYASLLSSP